MIRLLACRADPYMFVFTSTFVFSTNTFALTNVAATLKIFGKAARASHASADENEHVVRVRKLVGEYEHVGEQNTTTLANMIICILEF